MATGLLRFIDPANYHPVAVSRAAAGEISALSADLRIIRLGVALQARDILEASALLAFLEGDAVVGYQLFQLRTADIAVALEAGPQDRVRQALDRWLDAWRNYPANWDAAVLSDPRLAPFLATLPPERLKPPATSQHGVTLDKRMKPALEKYSWTEELDAFCLTIAVGARTASVENAFDIVPDSRKLTMVDEHAQFVGLGSAGNAIVQINTLDNAVVAFETNGWTGVDDYDQKTFSRIACPQYVSIFRNINAAMSFLFARNGQLVRRFDPLFYEADDALPEEREYAWGLEHPLLSAFALAETLTGVVITRDWLLGQAHPTYRTQHGKRR